MDLELMIFHPATVKLNVETLMLNVFKVISGQIIWKQILSVYFFRHFLCREAYRSIVLGSFGAFCWVFRVQGFHNRHCEWTDALVVRPGLRVCFALMALTHGPTYSLKICFFNWRSLVLTSGWTHFSGFPPVFFFFLHWLVLFHGIGPTLQEMPGVFGIRWNHLWLLIFFFVFMLVRPRLTDLWFFFCVLSFFLYMNQTRLSRTFVCVNASPRRHTEIRNKEHVSIWTLWCVFSFFLYHTWRLGSGHDDVDLSVGPDWNISTNTGQIAMKFFHRHSGCSENNPRWLFLKCHHEVSICGFEWSILTSIGWIAITFGIDIHVSARAAPNDYFHRQ